MPKFKTELLKFRNPDHSAEHTWEEIALQDFLPEEPEDIDDPGPTVSVKCSPSIPKLEEVEEIKSEIDILRVQITLANRTLAVRGVILSIRQAMHLVMTNHFDGSSRTDKFLGLEEYKLCAIRLDENDDLRFYLDCQSYGVGPAKIRDIGMNEMNALFNMEPFEKFMSDLACSKYMKDKIDAFRQAQFAERYTESDIGFGSWS